MTTNHKYYIVIDFEATCTNNKEFPSNEMEIIEFAGIVIDSNFSIVKEFGAFIKPIRHPQLTEFCTQLTTITQKDVDNAFPFEIVLKKFSEEIKLYEPVFLSWGDFDKHILIENCEFHNCNYPFAKTNHINVKVKIQMFCNLKKAKGVSGMLKYLKMNFIGTPHRGIDDVRNIIRILKKINYPLKELDIKI